MYKKLYIFQKKLLEKLRFRYLDGLSKNALWSGMHCSKNSLHPIGEILDPDSFFSKFCVFIYKNVVKIQQSIQNQSFRIGPDNKNVLPKRTR